MRPKMLEGKTIKFDVGCGGLYMTVNYKDKKPFELFINGSKLGTCRANHEGLSRLITLSLKKGVDIDAIIDQLELIKCPACSSAKAKLDSDAKKDYPTSCPDAVAKMLKEVK